MRTISTCGIAVGMTIAVAVVNGQQASTLAVSDAAVICMEAQRRSLGLLEAIDRRVETARQSNSPTEMRAAVADLQRGLLEIRTELSRCTALTATNPPATADPHAGHVMPGTPAQTGAPANPAERPGDR
jgi:hypothetical protein